MLLIAFYGKFCSFYKLFVPKVLSQSKHEEFESNSALQIRDQKERKAENGKKLEVQEILQARKFPSCAHCSSCSHCSFILHYFLPAPFTFLTLFLSLFGFLPILSFVIAFDFGSFCNFA